MEGDPREKTAQHLSIHLVKTAYTTSDEVIQLAQCDEPVEIPIAGYGKPLLFIKRTPQVAPKWTSLFREFVDPRRLAVPGVSAALFIDGRYTAQVKNEADPSVFEFRHVTDEPPSEWIRSEEHTSELQSLV